MIRLLTYYIAVQLTCFCLLLAGSHGSIAFADSLFIKVAPDTIAVREWQQDYSFEITVTDNQGRPRRVDVIVNDLLNKNISWLNTDSGGKAIYYASIPFGTPDGSYEITFQARKNLFESSEKLSRFVRVEHDYAKLNIKITPEAIFILDYDDKVDYSFTISDEYGNLIDSAGVIIESNLLKSPVKLLSGSDGSGEFTIIIPENTENGEYRLRFFSQKFGFTSSDTLIRIIRIKHLPSSVISGMRTSEVRLFPNPAGDFINIILPDRLINTDNIRIYDNSGRICGFGINAKIIRDSALRINLPKLAAGNYFIALSGRNSDYIFPIMIK